ncbi:iron-sulfur cluster assembly scaffold protein [Pelagibacteraceae bacterium]|jgi:nitrogen fixation protein NifU and related proteins|nr:iron-sulfur cluster assembly scaffold protein [Pelagibacteraceae bacterium]
MITKEIIRIASDTRNIGLTNKFHFRSSLKNSICGDKIKLELIVKHLKINSMKYEIESCVYCEASASLLAKKVKNLDLNSAIKDMCRIKEIIKNNKFTLPENFKDFKVLINKKNINRIKCINLPFDAVLKALS